MESNLRGRMRDGEVVSLTFLEAWRLRGRVEPDGESLPPWLMGITARFGVHVQSLGRARRLAYETNDAAMVRELTMSASLAARNGYRLDWTGTWESETNTPFYSPDDSAPLTVLISFELPAPVRVERLLMLGLGRSPHGRRAYGPPAPRCRLASPRRRRRRNA